VVLTAVWQKIELTGMLHLVVGRIISDVSKAFTIVRNVASTLPTTPCHISEDLYLHSYDISNIHHFLYAESVFKRTVHLHISQFKILKRSGNFTHDQV
jgi:hypothetical protein